MRKSILLITAVVLAGLCGCNPSFNTVSPVPSYTADEKILAALPDYVRFNPDRNEYYDSNEMEWDSVNKEYILKQHNVEPSGIPDDSHDTIEFWLEHSADLSNELDRAMDDVIPAIDSFFEAYPNALKLTYPFFAEDLWSGPYSVLARVRLDQLPRLYSYVMEDNPFSALLTESLQYLGSRIDHEEFAWHQRYTSDEFFKKYPDRPADMRCLITFTDRVVLAPDYLPFLVSSDHSQESKDLILSRFGIAGLPYMYEEIIEKGNEEFLPYAHAVLPAWVILRGMDEGVTIDGNTDLARIREYLSECVSDVRGVEFAGTFAFSDAPKANNPQG